MPVLNIQNFQNTPDGKQEHSPAGLSQNGPILDVLISIPQALVELYTKEKKTIPAPKTGIALIDTGATRSCVHAPIMEDLGVNPIGIATSGTANGQATHSLYPAHFSFPAAKIEIDLALTVGVNLTGQEAMGRPIIALIGRDILSLGIFVYSGHTGAFTIAV